MTDRKEYIKEYIERGALLEYLGADLEEDLQPEVVMEFVESIPVADVVEVVRCRECKKRYVPAYCALWYGQINDEHGCRDIFLRDGNSRRKGIEVMSEFQVNTDMFGWYVSVPTDFCGRNHIYKVVGRISSNYYCDTPILVTSEPKMHEEIIPVLNVIHCGVHEDKVVRVALSDCEIISEAATMRHGRWVFEYWDSEYINKHYSCSECGFKSCVKESCRPTNYCPNCGAKMDGKENEDACTTCRFYPPSSCDGKPCSQCGDGDLCYQRAEDIGDFHDNPELLEVSGDE